MLTIEDIRDDSLLEGFEHINKTSPGRWRAQAYGGKKTKAGHAWYGRTQKTREAAAQDYCDYMNSGDGTMPAKLKSAGHAYVARPVNDDPEVQAALGVLRDARGRRQGRQGYVYLIVEDREGGGLRYGKIGYSTNPRARVAELQTGNPRPLRLLYAMPGTEEDERGLHSDFAHDNVLQEWFRVSPELILQFPADTALDPYIPRKGRTA